MTNPWQRHVKIGDCDLYLGKSQDVIPALGKVNALITDPPYGINGSNGTIGKKRNKGAYTGVFPDTPEYIRDVIVPIIEASLSISDRGAVTTGGKNCGFYPNPTAVGGYVQSASSGLCVWGSCTLQPIFFYVRDPRIGKTITPITYYLNEAPAKVGHPCPKPQKAWTWLVNKSATFGQTVLDPFLGSGTTLISCASLGLKGIGIEMDPDYFEIACKRVQAAYDQPDLFVAPPTKPTQDGFDL